MMNRNASKSTDRELSLRDEFVKLIKETPIPDDQLIYNLYLYMNRHTLSRLLYFNELYKHIIGKPGDIYEFGVFWGRDLALLQNLRAIYDTFKYSRKIVGFDTFEGIPILSKEDGKLASIRDFSTTKNYEQYLEKILQYHEQESPISNIKKFEIVKGNVIKTLPKYLEQHPETIVAMVYFDLDVYAPTKECLEIIKPYLFKGSVVAFDEINYETYPGESIAIKEVLQLNNLRLRSVPYESIAGYCIWGE